MIAFYLQLAAVIQNRADAVFRANGTNRGTSQDLGIPGGAK